MFLVIIAQAKPITPTSDKEKIGKNLHTSGVRFEGYYKKIAHQLIKVHSQYNALFSSFNDSVKEAADKDNLPVPEFFTSWNEKYVAKADEAHQIYLDFLEELKKFRKNIDKAYKGH
jgi:hypothetical protein